MNLYKLLGMLESNQFKCLEDFSVFAGEFLAFVGQGGMQADIVSKNESKYHFFQYREEGHHAVTRPINMEIFLMPDEFEQSRKDFLYSLAHIKEIKEEEALRKNINRYLYTCQQSIGAALDAYNSPNKARKRNGLLFEVLIRSVLSEVGVKVDSGDEYLPIKKNNDKMKFQHDIILKDENGAKRAIGQLKTSSKDRLDKIFLDKYMYDRLADIEIPHFAIFLNDVQRKGTAPKFGINSTFLPGHFYAYTVALNPLNGVYYLDIRPNMGSNDFMRTHIKEFDGFLVEDMWRMIESV